MNKHEHSTGTETGIPRKGGYVPSIDLVDTTRPVPGSFENLDYVRYLTDLAANTPKIRTFTTGATRDTDEGKLDFEGFLHPAVLKLYAQYMSRHQTQSDGTLRTSDNWQKGIPPQELLKSMLRHVMDVWLIMRGFEAREDLKNALCGVYFNCAALMLAHIQDKSSDPIRTQEQETPVGQTNQSLSAADFDAQC